MVISTLRIKLIVGISSFIIGMIYGSSFYGNSRANIPLSSYPYFINKKLGKTYYSPELQELVDYMRKVDKCLESKNCRVIIDKGEKKHKPATIQKELRDANRVM